jgi:hypothetical protein
MNLCDGDLVRHRHLVHLPMKPRHASCADRATRGMVRDLRGQVLKYNGPEAFTLPAGLLPGAGLRPSFVQTEPTGFRASAQSRLSGGRRPAENVAPPAAGVELRKCESVGFVGLASILLEGCEQTHGWNPNPPIG